MQTTDMPIAVDRSIPEEHHPTLAKEMIDLLLLDLRGQGHAPTDLFGFVDDRREINKLDGLIWLYDLNPDGSDVPFTWACDQLNYDPEYVRRVTAKIFRRELKNALREIASMIGFDYARECELKLSEYIDLSGWNLN
jgi:hypothetical protein